MIENVETIDTLIRPIVIGLNRIGLKTCFSCQGNHSDNTSIAYISFSPGTTLPTEFIEKISAKNWQIDIDYDSGVPQYSVYSVRSCFVFDANKLQDRNTDFLEGWHDLLEQY